MTKDIVDRLNHLISRFESDTQFEFFNITEYNPASGVLKINIGYKLYTDINENKGYLKVEYTSKYAIKIENGILSLNNYALNENIRIDVNSNEILDIIRIFKDFITEHYNRYH